MGDCSVSYGAKHAGTQRQMLVASPGGVVDSKCYLRAPLSRRSKTEPDARDKTEEHTTLDRVFKLSCYQSARTACHCDLRFTRKAAREKTNTHCSFG